MTTKELLTKKQFVFIVLVIVWTGVIFSFSLQPAEISSELSRSTGSWIMETFFPYLEEWVEEMPTAQVEFWHTILRKCGHFSEFFILGILSIITTSAWELRFKLPKTLAICVMVASADETIQLFVPGRSGQISDVILDGVGALTGILALLALKRWSKLAAKVESINEFQENM